MMEQDEFECCDGCNQSETCEKSFEKMIRCQNEYEEYVEEQKKGGEEFLEYVYENPELYFCDDVARLILEDCFDED